MTSEMTLPKCHRCDQPIRGGQSTRLEMGTYGFVVHASCPVPSREQREPEIMLRLSLQDLKDLGLSIATRQWWCSDDPARADEMQRLIRLFQCIASLRSELEEQQATPEHVDRKGA